MDRHWATEGTLILGEYLLSDLGFFVTFLHYEEETPKSKQQHAYDGDLQLVKNEVTLFP